MAASEEIASGHIQIEARDEGALASLRRVEAQFDKTMSDIDRQEAEVRLLANSAQFAKEIKKAKAELDDLRKARAEAKIDADTGPLDRKIARLERDLAFIDKQKVKVDIDVDTATVKKARSELEGLSKLEDARNAAEAKRANERMRLLNQESRRRKALSDQRVREMASDESAAHRMDAQRDRDIVKVTQLQREYGRLSDKLEGLAKRHAFTEEARVKLDVDQRGAMAKFLLVKAELNRLGAHPPVGIKTDVDRSQMGIIRRFGASIGDVVSKVAQGAAGLSTMTIRFGPFTASVKQAIVATALLAPIITDLVGGATALAGVLGTALAGSMSVAGGLALGMAADLGGVFAMIKPLATQFKTAKQATDAYNKAVLQYGKHSKQAQDAQAKMNSVLKGVDPVVRQGAKGIQRAGLEWHKLTDEATHRDLGGLLTHGFKALDAVMPVVARNSKRSLGLITNSLSNVFDSMRADAGKAGGGMLGSLGRSFNNFLGPALSAATHIGAVLVHIGESAARIFGGRAGDALNKWASNLDKATQPGTHLDNIITRLGNHARDVGRLFMDFGRLMVTVFNGGADSGDNLVNQLDHAIRSWNTFLKSSEGKHSMETFFKRSADSVSSLAGALAPIAAAIGDWSNLLSPFTRGILDVIAFISRLFMGLTRIIGLGGPLTALGATFATLWAVGKAAAFVAMLSRVIGLIKEAYALARSGSILGGIGRFTGGIGGALKGGGAAAGITEASSIGAAEFRAQILSGATAGAAEIGAAMRGGAATGGAIAGAERAASGGVILPPGAAREVEGVGAAAARSGGKLRTAARGAAEFAGGLIGISGPAAAVVLGGAAIVGSMVAIDRALHPVDHRFRNWENTIKQSGEAAGNLNRDYMGLRDSLGDVGSQQLHANLSLKDAKKELDSTRKGTLAHREAVLNYRDALRNQIETQRQYQAQQKQARSDATKQLTVSRAAEKANTDEITALRKKVKEGGPYQDIWRAKLKEAEARQTALAAATQGAWNRVAAAPAQAARAMKGMVSLSGAAEQAVGKLARTAGGKSIATKISLKYEDPNKAGQVAAKARSALQSGVSKGAVLRIVADSRSADQAIARLRAARITPKKVTILESGGAHAVNVLEAIIGRKLVGKELKIAQHGGPAVISLLEAIVGHKLPPKVQSIGQRGAQAVLGFLARIGTFKLGAATKNILQAGGNAVLSFMEHLLNMNNLGRAVKTIVTNLITTHSKHAEGGMETPATKRLYDRAAGKQMIRATGGKFRAPTYIVGEEDKTEYIIATNPAYRKRNREYLTMAAGELGMEVVPGYAGGGAHAAGKHKKKPGGATKRHNRGPKTGSTKRLPLTSTDTTTSDFLSQYRANEVNAYNKVAGKINSDDKQLESLSHQYADTDSGRKGAHQRQSITRKIGRLRRERAGLMKRIPQLRKNRNAAIKAYQRGADLQNLIETDTTAMNTAATWYNNGDPMHGGVDQMAAWQRAKGDRETQLGNLKTLYEHIQKIAPPRFQTDITKTLGGIADDMASSQTEDAPTGPEPAAKPTLEDFISAQGLTDILTGLQTAYSLAQTNNVPDDPTTIYKNESVDSLADDLTAAGNLRDFYTNLLNTAQTTGQSNDIIKDAADALVGARGDYQGIADTISGATSSTTTIGAQMMALSTARQELYSSFGSNFNPVWSQPNSFPSATRPQPLAGPYGPNPSGTGVGGTGSTTIHQTNNFSAPPPDPHTWSKGVAWELQAAV